MPQVGTKKFAYTPKGEAAAKRYSKKSGKKLVVKKPAKKALPKNNGKITTAKAMYDNQLVGASSGAVRGGY